MMGRRGTRDVVRAAVYVRISQDREGAGLGVQRQEADCRALAERHGWAVTEVYVDNDVSAYRGRPRAGYMKLLGDIGAGLHDVVIAWHSDRLHRSPTELEHYIATTEANDVATHTVQAGEIDLSTPAGRMHARIAGAVARHESEHRGARVAAAREQRARAGRWGGGVRPFGFEADGITVRPSEAVEILQATNAILAGTGLRSVVRDLNARGIVASTGRLWSSTMLRDVLMRARNAGLSAYRGEIVGELPGKPIVSEEQWRAVTAILTDPGRRTNARGAKPRWLGSGLYLCGVCGRPKLRVSSSGNRTPNYRCDSRNQLPRETGHVTRNARYLDELVGEIIVRRLGQPGAVDLLADGPAEVDTGALHLEAATLQQRLADLSTAFADGVITMPQLREGTERLRGLLAGVDEQLDAAARVDPLSRLVDTPDVAAVWAGADIGLRRAVLDTLMTVTVLPVGAKRGRGGERFDPDSIDIAWKR